MELLEIASAPAFWKSLFEIIVVNIILSGDNAVVIALAARHLPRRSRRKRCCWAAPRRS